MRNDFHHSQLPLSDALTHIFETTVFEVFDSPAFQLRVGAVSEALAPMYKRLGVQSAAFLMLSAEGSNPDLKDKILSELRFRSLNFLEGVGRSTLDQSETPGFFIWGLSSESSKTLAKKHGQPALVWCDVTGMAHLHSVQIIGNPKSFLD